MTMGTDMGTMPWVWVRVLHVEKSLVRVRDHIHGYRYKLCIWIIMGMGKGTTSLLR